MNSVRPQEAIETNGLLRDRNEPTFDESAEIESRQKSWTKPFDSQAPSEHSRPAGAEETLDMTVGSVCTALVRPVGEVRQHLPSSSYLLRPRRLGFFEVASG